MRIAVVSDLHKGSGGGDDDFSGPDRAWAKRYVLFLDHLVHTERAERLVAAGDNEELWQGRSALVRPLRRLAGIRRQYARIRKYNRDTYEAEERHRVEKLLGNHDLLVPERRPRVWIAEADGVRVLVEHGDLADPLNAGDSPAARLGAWAIGQVERLWADFDDLVYGPSRLLLAHPTRERYVEYAGRRLREERCHVVVMGHTHDPMVHDYGDGRTYLNDGSCIDGSFHYAVIDTRTGERRLGLFP